MRRPPTMLMAAASRRMRSVWAKTAGRAVHNQVLALALACGWAVRNKCRDQHSVSFLRRSLENDTQQHLLTPFLPHDVEKQSVGWGVSNSPTPITTKNPVRNLPNSTILLVPPSPMKSSLPCPALPQSQLGTGARTYVATTRRGR